jgi:hypothetical protein
VKQADALLRKQSIGDKSRTRRWYGASCDGSVGGRCDPAAVAPSSRERSRRYLDDYHLPGTGFSWDGKAGAKALHSVVNVVWYFLHGFFMSPQRHLCLRVAAPMS